MALLNSSILQVNVSLTAPPVTVAGFGTVAFVTNEQWFAPRQQVYTSIDDATSLPEGSIARTVVTKAFAQDEQPAQFILARQRASLDITPTGVADTVVYNITLTVNDGASVVASYTAGASEDEEDVCVGLKADIDAVTDVTDHITATIVGTGSSAVLSITADTVTDDFQASTISDNLTLDFTSTESAEAAIAAITAEADTAFYYGYHNHTQPEVLAMATALATRGKMYIYSLADTNILTAWDGITAAVDTPAKLTELTNDNAIGLWHQDADTLYPEVTYATRFAGRQPGTIVWDKSVIKDITTSKNSSGNVLSSTELSYLASRNMNCIRSYGGQVVPMDGKVASGRWIDQVTSKYFIAARITEAWQSFNLNSLIITGDNNGISKGTNVIETEMSRYVSSDVQPNILSPDEPISVKFPRASERTPADIDSRTIRGTVVAKFSNALQNLVLNVTLTN